MKTGNPNNYPFDSYDTFMSITALILATNDSLPLTVYTQGAVQGFTYTTHFQGFDDGSKVDITFNIQRSATTRLFAAVVFLREFAR